MTIARTPLHGITGHTPVPIGPAVVPIDVGIGPGLLTHRAGINGIGIPIGGEGDVDFRQAGQLRRRGRRRGSLWGGNRGLINGSIEGVSNHTGEVG